MEKTAHSQQNTYVLAVWLARKGVFLRGNRGRVILILELGKSEVELQIRQLGLPPFSVLQKLDSAVEVCFARTQQAELVVSLSCYVPIELRRIFQLGPLFGIGWFRCNDHRPPFHSVDGILKVIPTTHAAAQVNLEALLVLHCG